METFSQYVARNLTKTQPFTEIGKHRVLKMLVDENGTSVALDTSKLDLLSADSEKLLLKAGQSKDLLFRMEILILTRIFGDGPKVFRPTSEQMFALERMNLNLTFGEFQMPFDTMIIELPEAYSKARTPKTEKTADISILFREAGIYVHCLWHRNSVHKNWFRSAPDMEIEDWFVADILDESREALMIPELRVDEEDRTMEQMIRRASLNYCLLLDEVGVKKFGHEFPEKYSDLLRTSVRNKGLRKQANQAIQIMPVIYGLEKKPTELIRVVNSDNELPIENPTGRKMPPHSRRGHYRHLRFEDGTLKKRIRIPPTIVNKHLLIDPNGGIYRT